MAGDWIKVRHDLPDDPAVIGISSAMNTSADDVVGKLIRIWCWADRHTENGCARNVTKAFIDSHVGATGFAQAMQSVGWLKVEKDSISFPNWERHISKSAKARGLSAERMKRSRCAKTATKAQPEKRREEKRIKKDTTYPQKNGWFGLVSDGSVLKTERFAAALADWSEHRREIKKKLTPLAVKRQLKELEAMGHDRAIEAIGHSIAQGWTGIHEDARAGTSRGGRQPSLDENFELFDPTKRKGQG